ncbi:LysM domain-containing protein [Vreelandella rituensis]|uniref:LysM peptidoglycan-binding domain-containing protein n=1 Tax=Vreelandella rituensis TaxID=2282306 RepID=A0A368UDJ4_9GAMM|nr:LysM domain-containing protein [Halomonas rituensis]RCV93863.1 LysM peptidoglycan-binding domain-containing protein [Halomonas rituensis]
MPDANQNFSPVNNETNLFSISQVQENLLIIERLLEHEAEANRNRQDRQRRSHIDHFVQSMAKKHRDDGLEGQALAEAVQSSVARTSLMSPKEMFPDIAQELAAERAAMDMPEISEAHAFFKEHAPDLYQDHPDGKIDDVIRLAAQYSNTYPDEPSLFDQIKTAAKSPEFKQNLIKYGSYGLMAGMLVGTGGAAAPAMVVSQVMTRMLPHMKNAGQRLVRSAGDALVRHDIVSQQNYDKASDHMNRLAYKASKSKIMTFGRVAGMVALGALVTGTVTASSLISPEGLTALGEQPDKWLSDDAIAAAREVAGAGDQVSEEAIAAAREVAGISDPSASMEGSNTNETGNTATQDVANPENADGSSNGITSISAHQLSGALHEAGIPATQINLFHQGAILGQAEMIDILNLSTSPEDVLRVMVEQGIDATSLEQAYLAEFGEALTVTETATPPSPPTLDAATASETVTSPTVEPAIEPVPLPPIEYTVQPGDTLSDLIQRALVEEGIPWDSERVYGAGGLVDQIAAANLDTITSPDLIYPGDTIQLPLDILHGEPQYVQPAPEVAAHAQQPIPEAQPATAQVQQPIPEAQPAAAHAQQPTPEAHQAAQTPTGSPEPAPYTINLHERVNDYLRESAQTMAATTAEAGTLAAAESTPSSLSLVERIKQSYGDALARMATMVGPEQAASISQGLDGEVAATSNWNCTEVSGEAPTAAEPETKPEPSKYNNSFGKAYAFRGPGG